jgi:hypothetical protein
MESLVHAFSLFYYRAFHTTLSKELTLNKQEGFEIFILGGTLEYPHVAVNIPPYLRSEP